jgi:Xaa-Pro dipeptidase
MTEGIKPITPEERAQRIEKARKLMRANRLEAIFIGPGSTMFYFTGTRWRGDSASLSLIIPAQGDVAWIVKADDESEARKLLRTGGDVRTWDSGRTQEKAIAEVLSDRHAATGKIGLEEQVPFSVYDGLRKVAPRRGNRKCRPGHHWLPRNQIAA